LGTAADRAALIDGIKTGIIDAIAIDHTPRTYEEKTVSFVDAPPGAIGLEFALPLLWTNLVERGIFNPLELWQALSTAPAHCLGQTPSQCVDNAALECILFNPQASWEINAQTLNSRSRNTHLWGEKVTGKVQRVFLPSTA
jgi:dihydroorotase